MDIQLLVDGVVLDGVKQGAVKLNIQNADPLTFSDPSSSYSGSITVPRSSVNDRVFQADRFPWLFEGSASHTAKILFGGLPSPVGEGNFRVQVTVSEDSYSLTLIEGSPKLSTIKGPARIEDLNPSATRDTAYNGYDAALEYAYNKRFNRPLLKRSPTGTQNVEPVYMMPIEFRTRESFIGSESQLVFLCAYDYEDGARYPFTSMVAMDSLTNWAVQNLQISGTTHWIDLTFDTSSFIWLPSDLPATVYLRCTRIASGSTGIAFTRTGSATNGAYKYVISGTSTMRISPAYSAYTTFFIYSVNSDSGGTEYSPVTNRVTASGYNITFSISAVSHEVSEVRIGPEIGFSSAYELVNAYCKAFCWTYDLTTNPFRLTLRPFINPSTATTYRIDWSGRIEQDSVKVSEASGAARAYQARTGDLTIEVEGARRSLTYLAANQESSLPVKVPQVAPTAIMIQEHTDGHTPLIDSYFSRNNGYYAYVQSHYAWFSPGWQVSAKMRLSYFDIKNMKKDAIYFVGELNHWFYVRSIQSWDPSTGTATVTLIAVKPQ